MANHFGLRIVLGSEMKLVSFEFEKNDKSVAPLTSRNTVLNKHTVPTTLTRELLLYIVEKIVVHEATGDWRKGTREQELEIFYRFIGELQAIECSPQKTMAVSL